MPTPRTCVGYNSPANGYMMRNDADIIVLDTKNITKVSKTASSGTSTVIMQHIPLK